MKFRAGDLEFTASVMESSQAPSAQTGQTLQSLTIQFRAQKAGIHEAAVAEALQRQSGGLYSLGESDQAEREWRVRESNWTYVGSEPWGVNHHVWRIEQVERLEITRLIVGSVELEPYEYTEALGDDGAVRLAARALASADDLEALSRLAGPIVVQRLGISDVPRSMRLSGYVWGERPDGLGVALACEDIREPRVTITGFDGSLVDDFEDLLRLGAFDVAEFRGRRHARRKVADIDGWTLMA